MSRSTRKYEFAPRLMTRFDLAVYLRRSEGWLAANLPRLLEQGFPPADPLLGLFDRIAVDAWLDRRANLPAATAAAPDPAMSEAVLIARIKHAAL
jgi:hypothetical protein